VAALLGLVPLLGCATTPLHERDWVEATTPHFEILSSLGGDETLEVARDAELFHAAVEFVMGTPLRPPPIPTRIYAFDGRGFERPFDQRGAPGYFRPSLREAVIVLRTGGGWRSDATETLRHEYVHHLLRNQGGFGRHLWFDEGAAEFLSTADVKGDHQDLGRLNEDHVRHLREQTWVPILRILRAEDLEGWGERKRRIFRAESWLFVHYLNFGIKKPGAGQAQLADYFRLVAEGISREKAVQKAFGMSSGALDRKLQRYLRSERFDSVAIRLGDAEGTGPLQPRPLARDEVLSELGWLSISLGRGDQAQRYFEMAVAANPRNARAHAGLGAADALRGRWDAAVPHYGRALGVAPDDARVQLDTGGYYYGRAGETSDPEARGQLAQLARSHYARSRQLDDSIPEAYAMYGATFTLEGEDTERALEPLEHAGRMLPSSLEIELRRARVQASLGRRGAARRLALSVLSRTHSDATRAQAQEILAGLGESIAP
jgi:tetratricopeptide (TPR) repeat protein